MLMPLLAYPIIGHTACRVSSRRSTGGPGEAMEILTPFARGSLNAGDCVVRLQRAVGSVLARGGGDPLAERLGDSGLAYV